MRVALIADIHGNADALCAVLDAARAEKVERILIMGDLVGYYADTRHVLEMLEEWDWVSVGGNHEAMLEQWRRGEDVAAISATYGTALAETLATLDPKEIDMLVNLPPVLNFEVAGRQVRLCHGTPWNRDEYIYPDADEGAKMRFAEYGLDLVAYGHTHYPTQWRVGATLVVNPGSVGQPRDHKPGACWALWNPADNTVEQRRETYDMQPLVARCQARDPDLPFLWTVLTRTSD